MIQKRYRVVLLVALAAAGVLATCVAVVALREDPEWSGFKRVRRGMTQDGVIALLGRPPDEWAPLSGGLPAPPFSGPPPGGVRDCVMFWSNKDGRVAVVTCEGGVVEGTNWYDYRQPFSERLRRWLNL